MISHSLAVGAIRLQIMERTWKVQAAEVSAFPWHRQLGGEHHTVYFGCASAVWSEDRAAASCGRVLNVSRVPRLQRST